MDPKGQERERLASRMALNASVWSQTGVKSLKSPEKTGRQGKRECPEQNTKSIFR
jgi:hypothetical protein